MTNATKASYTKDSEKQSRTEWYGVQVWGKLGEYAAAFNRTAAPPSDLPASPAAPEDNKQASLR